ncbi:MAG TPA: DinB family protein [Gemmatimonadaceae bacterium]
MQDYVIDLRETIEKTTPRLAGMSDESSRRRPAPGKWSPREIIGHLIDSASNNHQRFVRAQFQDSLVFPGYHQNAWVAAQRYQDAPWRELVTLWRTFNLHIAWVMETTPPEQRQRARAEHNLDVLAWQQVPREQPTTLDYFMADYVGHLKHHLAQIEIER